MVTNLIPIGLALAGGALGKAAGDSKITGSKEWDKILGPVCAIAAATLYKRFGGDGEFTNEQAINAGALIGAAGIGVYSALKGGVNFVASLFKKKEKK